MKKVKKKIKCILFFCLHTTILFGPTSYEEKQGGENWLIHRKQTSI